MILTESEVIGFNKDSWLGESIGRIGNRQWTIVNTQHISVNKTALPVALNIDTNESHIAINVADRSLLRIHKSPTLILKINPCGSSLFVTKKAYKLLCTYKRPLPLSLLDWLGRCVILICIVGI